MNTMNSDEMVPEEMAGMPAFDDHEAMLSYFESQGVAPEKINDYRQKTRILQCADLYEKLWQLLADINDGSQTGKLLYAEECVYLAETFAQKLVDIDVNVLKEIAAKRSRWPMLLTLDAPILLKQQEDFLRTIGLGQNKPISLDGAVLVKKMSLAKFVAYSLFGIVKISRQGKNFRDVPFKSIVQSIGKAHYTMWVRLIDLVKGYPPEEWDQRLTKQMADAIKSLPDISTESFNQWFLACKAVLICVTNDRFEEPRHGLATLGAARAQRFLKSDLGEARGQLREGITLALKDALASLLKVPRRKSKK